VTDDTDSSDVPADESADESPWPDGVVEADETFDHEEPAEEPTSEPVEPEEHVHIDSYEKNWIRIAIATLILFFIAVLFAGLALGIQVPSDEGRVDPNTLNETAPWSEPGLRTVVEGEEYDLYIVASRFSFDPNQVTVPRGAKVNVYATSADVQHGFILRDTNVNMMLIPGQVSKLSADFDTVGTYDFICQEYCGLGHAVMFGQIIVEEPVEGE
jgi:cytochrome c oxidase subunit 2